MFTLYVSKILIDHITRTLRHYDEVIFETIYVASIIRSSIDSIDLLHEQRHDFCNNLKYCQILFYLLGIIFSPIRYFLKVNIASFLAIIDWLLGKKQNTWQVIR